jgi:hypothetical protein
MWGDSPSCKLPPSALGRPCLSFEVLTSQIRLDLAYEKNEANIAQQTTAEDVKVLTWITFVSDRILQNTKLVLTSIAHIAFYSHCDNS